MRAWAVLEALLLGHQVCECLAPSSIPDHLFSPIVVSLFGFGFVYMGLRWFFHDAI